ncbi:MAG: UvrD-helicase domain-containing protein, partial [Bacillota bacterium]
MIDTELKDAAARRAIVEDLDTCILVEAGAGSGKTHSLVERMVSLITENKCAVEKIAAVTFTRKAAAELNGRFQLALEKALAAETDGTKKERLNRALKELDRCFLGTIHSFCAVLLRERPIEAGLDPDFVEMEELEDRLLREKVWEDYLIGLQAQNPQALEELNKIGVEARDLKGCFDTLSAYPEVEPVREPAPPPGLDTVREELDKLLRLAQTMLPGGVPPKGWDDLQKMLRRALQWRRIFDLDHDLTLLRLLAALDKEGSITQNRWPNAENAKTMLAAFTAFRKDSLTPALRAWREHRHARLVDFVLPAVELYRRHRMERSRLNFQDLLMNTADLLRQNPEVRRCLQQRYSRLLVDEFQDTDPIQAEIMFYLTGRDVGEKDWRRLVPIPGSLFVVGDLKQAIYRFRRADIDTYNEVKRLIAGSGGKVLHLTTNFRSVHAVGEWVNPVFKTLLPEDATPYQAAFAGMDTVRDSGGGTAAGIRTISIPKFNRNNQDEIARADAGRIAGWIRRALDGGVKLSRTPEEIEEGFTEKPVPGDFMILLRYKDNMDLYARALEERRIPFCIAGGGGFSKSAETAELLKILRSLLDPGDPVRLAAVLRGGLFGLSDKQLWRFRQAGGRFSFLDDVPDALSPEDRERFEWAFASLRRFYEWTQSLPASAALENIVRELGVIPYALTGELGKSRAGHLIQCLEYAAAAERRGITSFSSLVDYLTILADSGVEEEINIAPWEKDAVRLMNLHKAKGLEAPVVFLANPGKNVKFGPAVHIQRSGDAPRGYFVIEKRKEYASETLGQPLDWEELSAVEQRYQDAEEMRLLYV